MNKDDLMVIRPSVESDKNFIMATALRGLYYGESWFSEIKKSVFMEHYHKTLEYIIAKDTTEVKVACLREDPEVILGYAILSPSLGVAHWVFVKKAWRGIGIGASLVSFPVKSVSHLTKLGLSIIRKKCVDFNPFLL